MENIEFSIQAKLAQSWMVISELLKQIDGDYLVSVLHPGGGQYDTLTLISEKQGQPVQLNRLGDSALVAGNVISNIWYKAALSPRDTASEIVNVGNFSKNNNPEKNIDAVSATVLIARFLSSGNRKSRNAIWGWNDSPGWSGPSAFPESLEIPENWKTVQSPIDGGNWEKWVYILTEDDKEVALVNLFLNQVIKSKGSGRLQGVGEYFDENGVPIAPIAFSLTMRMPGESKYQLDMLTKPGNEWRAAASYEDEGFDVSVEPVYQLSEMESVRLIWQISER